MRTHCAILLAVMLLGGCSHEQLYNSMQGARDEKCQKIIDGGERARCLDNAHQPYDKYRQQREEPSKN
ncbi:MAG: hypothetical protein JWM78_331 [Verrucomicrobiaceae bacterium]|nr:hypothetical protein [Verrucomicrobiaceae bacterium]